MRTAIVGLLIGGLSVAACDRTQSPAAAGTALAAPPASATSAAAGDSTPAPGAPAAATGKSVGNATRAAAWREVTIPSGTSLPVILETSVGSDTSRVEEAVHARLAHAITIRGVTALAEGSTVTGVVTDATPSAKVKGRAHVALRFDSVSPRGEDERYPIQTSSIGRTAAATKKEDTVKILAPAAGGALIGRIAGGRKGALIGTAAGAGAGTAFVMSTRGKEVRLEKGTALTLKLAEPLVVRVRE